MIENDDEICTIRALFWFCIRKKTIIGLEQRKIKGKKMESIPEISIRWISSTWPVFHHHSVFLYIFLFKIYFNEVEKFDFKKFCDVYWGDHALVFYAG